MSAFIKQFNNKKIAVYLLINAVILILLIPGGLIENRDFSHISTLILIAFNAFLTALGMCSLLFIPLAMHNYRAVAIVSKILATAYLAVYLLDLLSIFPQTPSVMPPLLMVMEIAGIGCALLLLIEGYKFEKHIAQSIQLRQEKIIKTLSPTCILVLVLIGNAVVIFSTYSAIHSGN